MKKQTKKNQIDVKAVVPNKRKEYNLKKRK